MREGLSSEMRDGENRIGDGFVEEVPNEQDLVMAGIQTEFGEKRRREFRRKASNRKHLSWCQGWGEGTVEKDIPRETRR